MLCLIVPRFALPHVFVCPAFTHARVLSITNVLIYVLCVLLRVLVLIYVLFGWPCLCLVRIGGDPAATVPACHPEIVGRTCWHCVGGCGVCIFALFVARPKHNRFVVLHYSRLFV